MWMFVVVGKFEEAWKLVSLNLIMALIDKSYMKKKGTYTEITALKAKSFQKEWFALMEYTPGLVGQWIQNFRQSVVETRRLWIMASEDVNGIKDLQEIYKEADVYHLNYANIFEDSADESQRTLQSLEEATKMNEDCTVGTDIVYRRTKIRPNPWINFTLKIVR